MLKATSLHNLGFLLALALVLALGWQARRTQEALLQANASVTRSMQLLSVVQGTLSALQDVETGMRGFLITGSESYLEPFHRGQAELQRRRRELHRLFDSQPGYRDWLARTEGAIDRRVQLAHRNVAVRRQSGLAEAAERVRSREGKQAMDQVRALIAQLQTIEHRRLADEHAAIEQRVRRLNQFTLWLGLAALALLLGALASVNRNLRQRLRLAAQAQAGEARQTAILQAIPDMLWQVDAAGDFRRLSDDPQAPLPESLRHAIRRVLPTVGLDTGVCTLHGRDEAGREFELRLVAAGDSHLAIVRDVTEAARNRRELRDQREFLRTIVDTDENLIFVRDPGGRFALCNVAFCSLLELAPAQMEGRTPEALARYAIVAPLLQGDQALLQERDEWGDECVRIVDARGAERWFQVLKRPLVLSGSERHVLTVAVDISARLRAERMKDEFVSTVSHELRTPLTSVRGALGMIAGGMAGDVPEAARPLVDIAHKNTERLVRLINDILDIEKLEAGRLQLQRRPLPLRPLLEQSIEQNATYAREFDVALALAPGEDGIAEVDPDRFAQVLANLLSNAIKHSRPGGTVEVELTRRDRGLEVCVRDHGEGIPENFRSKVFERFAQADSSDARRRGGTGLGLAITRSLVEQMGGRIGFDSIVGEGTRFAVWLPETQPAAPAAAAPDDSQHPCIVLLQDDPAVALELATMLAGHGYRTFAADSPARVRELLDDARVMGLAIDLGASGDPGLVLLRELRAQPRYRHLPVLLLGLRAAAGNDGGLRGGAVGVVDWLGKPLDPEQVAHAVRECLRGGRRTQPDVLHVEDDADVREVVRGLLAGHRLALHEAGSLAEAREQLAQRHHDLVILDLMLPDGDGAELLPELGQARPPTPVIVFSARDTPGPESRNVLLRLVKSRSDAAELAALILENLRNWPVSPPEESR